MPNPLSWYFHHLPKPLHRVECAANHVAQLVVPFALFLPQPVASIAAPLMIATQLWLCLSGNFAWLNWITIVLACSVVDGSWSAAALPGRSAGDVGTGVVRDRDVMLFAARRRAELLARCAT